MMISEIKKRFCLIYDTFKEMITDPDIISDMVVMTLGHDKIDDKKGGIYKIVTKDSINLKKAEGESFGYKSPFFALSISSNIIDELKTSILQNEQTINCIEKTLNSSLTNNIYKNRIIKEIYLDELKTLKIIEADNGIRYILNENKNCKVFSKVIKINEENSWIIPTEFVISNYFINYKVFEFCSIKYEDNLLKFEIEFKDSNVIPYY